MVNAGQAEEHAFSLAIRSGDLLFCSGHIGQEADGRVPTDPTRQYRLTFDAIADTLAQEGLTPADVVDMTSFHVGFPAHMDVFDTERRRFLGSARPAWTAIGVAALGYPESLVEVKVIARRREG